MASTNKQNYESNPYLSNDVNDNGAHKNHDLNPYDNKPDIYKKDSTSNRETIINQRRSSGMTPSIITTINNTSPSPQNFENQASLIDQNNTNNNITSTINNNNPNTNRKKKSVPQSYYESYIEDSFVGHWEREDDDPEEDNNHQELGVEDDSDSILHSSTIEFEFDSFGPESIIYAPSSSKGLNTTTVNKQSQQTIVSETITSDDNVQSNIDLTNDGLEKAQTTLNASTPEKIKAFREEGMDDNKEVTQDKPNHQNVNIDKEELRENVDLKMDDSRGETVDNKEADISSNTRSALPSQIINSPFDEEQIDLKVIEPYRRVISHAGYCHFVDPGNPSHQPHPSEPAPAVIVFSACYLPDRSRRDYDYVMDHLFLYVLTSLHELIADDYILIFFHNTQPSTATTTSKATSSNVQTSAITSSQQPVSNNNLPSFTWIKRCYQLIGRKLRKNLRVLYMVKPTFWLKTIVIMCRPFISSKFNKKIHFIEDLDGLKKCIPVDKLILPASADNL